MSFYSADAHPRALSDLEGVLCARGQVVVFGRGTTARLSVVLGMPPAPPEEEPDEETDEESDAGPHDAAPGDEQADLEPEPPADDPADAPAADVATRPDPADLEFLDLDPEELAAVLAPPPVRRASRPSLGPRPGVVGTSALADPLPATAPVAPVAPVAPPDPVTQWRARSVRCALRARGVDAELDRAPDGRPVVRSAFRADLTELAARWTRGAVKAVPVDLELDGPRLRLWVLTAGRRVGRAYLLGLDPHAPHTHGPLLEASRRAGLGATLGGDRSEPVLRIVGRRRQGRLSELVGDPPGDLPPEIWPG